MRVLRVLTNEALIHMLMHRGDGRLVLAWYPVVILLLIEILYTLSIYITLENCILFTAKPPETKVKTAVKLTQQLCTCMLSASKVTSVYDF